MGRTARLLVVCALTLGMTGCLCSRELRDVRYELERVREELAEGTDESNAELEQMKKTQKEILDVLNRDWSARRRRGTQPGPE